MLEGVLNFVLGSYRVTCIGSPHRAATFVLKCCPFACLPKRRDDGMSFTIPARYRKRVSAAAYEYGLTVTFDDGHGLARLFERYRRRIGIPVGLLLFFGMLWLSGNVVWNITLDDDRGASREVILERLGEMGLQNGAFIPSLDLDSMCTRYILEYDDLSWISVNMYGNTAKVEVLRELRRPAKESDVPSDLVSKCDGQIVRFNVTSGTPVTKVDETVLEGQPLVSGIVQYKDGSVRAVRSVGEVYAYTRRSLEVFVPYGYVRRVPTGVEKTYKTLRLFGINIKLYINELKSNESCDKIAMEKVFSLPSGVKLPISLTTVTCTEYAEASETLTKDAARAMAEARMEEAIAAACSDCELLSRTVAASDTEDGCKVTAELYCIENISVEKELFTEK